MSLSSFHKKVTHFSNQENSFPKLSIHSASIFFLGYKMAARYSAIGYKKGYDPWKSDTRSPLAKPVPTTLRSMTEENKNDSSFTGYTPKIMQELQYRNDNATSISFNKYNDMNRAEMRATYEHNKPGLSKGARQYEINKPKMRKLKKRREDDQEWDEIMSRIQQLKERYDTLFRGMGALPVGIEYS